MADISTRIRMQPESVGVLHFIGIGGIGMSGIAEILFHLGYQVQGSDLSSNANVTRLEAKGIPVKIGHVAKNVENVAVVIKSSAVKDTNPEIMEARKRGIPVLKRAEMLAELMRLKLSVAVAGTHGKTTTTSLVAALFEAASLSPTVINGGIINTHGTNAYLGQGDFLIAEADESDGTFIKVPAHVAIITNIDPEHLDYYGSFDVLKAAFRTFIENLPFYGFAVLCQDHPEVAALIRTVHDRKILSYGLEGACDVQATNIRQTEKGSVFDVVISARVKGGARTLKEVTLPIHGRHNVQNSLAAITVALELGFQDTVIVEGFKAFQGVKRRFTLTGEVDGVRIIDDYGHHPKEIAATLATAKGVVSKTGGRIIAVVQPHRYTRLHDLWDSFATCFSDADSVIVADIYTAGEEPIAGVTQAALVDAIRGAGKHKDVERLNSPDDLASLVLPRAQSGDMVVCLGAGSITQWAYALPEKLKTAKQGALA